MQCKSYNREVLIKPRGRIERLTTESEYNSWMFSKLGFSQSSAPIMLYNNVHATCIVVNPIDQITKCTKIDHHFICQRVVNKQAAQYFLLWSLLRYHKPRSSNSNVKCTAQAWRTFLHKLKFNWLGFPRHVQRLFYFLHWALAAELTFLLMWVSYPIITTPRKNLRKHSGKRNEKFS